MDLAMQELRISRAYKNAYAADIEFDSSEVGIKLEGEYVITCSGKSFRMTPEADSDEQVRRCFEPIIGVAVDSAVAEESGELSVRFVDGSLLEAGPGDRYEPWSYYGPGLRVWSLPGGKITSVEE